MDAQLHLARRGRAILDEHERLRAVRRLLIALSAVSVVAIVVCVAALSGWAGAAAVWSIVGWVAAAVSAVAVPLCALLATGVRRGRRFVLGMIEEYDRLQEQVAPAG